MSYAVQDSPPILRTQIDLSRIGIMEDDLATRQTIRRAIEDLGGTVFEVFSEEDVVRLAAERHIRTFILDIHMGSNRTQAGLDALERLKAYDPGIFVSVLSNHQNYREMAERLNVDFFRDKTWDKVADVRSIIQNLLDQAEKRLSEIKAGIGGDHLIPEGEPDPNYLKLKELSNDQAWLSRHLGLYIAIVRGEIAAIDKDEDRVIEIARSSHPESDRFITRIFGRAEVEEIDIPTPLGVE